MAYLIETGRQDDDQHQRHEQDGNRNCPPREPARLELARHLHGAGHRYRLDAHAVQCTARRWWTRRTAIEPSPTAEATLLTEPEWTSPTAKIPGWLVSRKKGRSSP